MQKLTVFGELWQWLVEGCRKLAWNNPKWITVAMRSGATGLVWGKLDKTTDSKTVRVIKNCPTRTYT